MATAAVCSMGITTQTLPWMRLMRPLTPANWPSVICTAWLGLQAKSRLSSQTTLSLSSEVTRIKSFIMASAT